MQWNNKELMKNVSLVHTTIDDLSRATINKLIAGHVL